MSTPNAAQLLAMANVQMAAEARLDLFGNQATVAALTFGNSNSSRFTPIQASAFAGEWRVIDHRPDTVSGKLFEYTGQNDPAGGLTLSAGTRLTVEVGRLVLNLADSLGSDLLFGGSGNDRAGVPRIGSARHRRNASNDCSIPVGRLREFCNDSENPRAHQPTNSINQPLN